MAEQVVDTDGGPVPGKRLPPPVDGRPGPPPQAEAGPAAPSAGRGDEAGGLWSGATRAVLFAAAASVGSGFAGRRRELLSLRADIDRAGLDTLAGRKPPRSRVLLIAGRPGSGRTALAEELVRRLADDYPDGVLRARLAMSGGDPVPVERTARDLLAVVGVSVPAGADEDELSEALRDALAGKRVLLLLDDAVGAEQVDALLPDAPDGLVVAVSRGPLTGVPDVRPCTLGGLDVSAAIGLLAQYAGTTRITCDPTAAQSLVEECGGQPAALVLAGGWLAARPQASVADVVNRLRELPPGTGDQDRGARPLARAFRLAYEALPPAAARLLRLLVLAPGGWADAQTASALAGCSVSDAEAALEGFVAHGLLRPLPDRRYLVPGCLDPMLRAALRAQERRAEVELAGARMLERTVRQLHACRLAAQPAGSPARKKLAGMPRSLRFTSSGAAASWLESRLPALLEAARLAVEDGGLDTLARRLVAGLTLALGTHRSAEKAAPELYGLHRLLLDVARRRDLPAEEAAALLNLGDLDARAGRVEESLVRYKHALDAARDAGDPYTTGRSLESIGGTYEDLGDWHRAADWYGRALQLRLSQGDRIGEARLYERLGTVHSRTGQWGEALRAWRAAGAAFRRAGNPQGALRAAEALDRLGDPGAAEAHRRAARRLAARQRGGSGAGEKGRGSGAGEKGRGSGVMTEAEEA
ncbi:tetratricopeptide repeat protein [Streptomyces lonegramiae]|uniref:Tetratricopeptide repeat protein n=1 Tax=Streptomyces lonegramiae TaxID=3075524 RepID=A0ABU2XWA4_9ACTN|nr:tetratricopeptide repeat protein [Streptomyces sp. DSM 41529]MDT0550208.1 tetratricopeptide repeat protein [Streptomyces sp. DSM 41529]